MYGPVGVHTAYLPASCAGTHNRACMPDTGVRKTYLSGPSYYLLRYEHARFCVEVLIRPV